MKLPTNSSSGDISYEISLDILHEFHMNSYEIHVKYPKKFHMKYHLMMNS